MKNILYYGDNLYYLRELDSSCVDLVYLDPPFNSKSNYNLLFRTPQGDAVQAQTTAFKDTWQWDQPAEDAFDDVVASGSPVSTILPAMRRFLGESDIMAYLAMMSVRLIEMRRVLRESGSLYLHCDPTASHYLKLILDGIFGADNFRNEVIWKRTTAHSDSRTRFSHVTDTLLFYAASKKTKWHPQYRPHADSYVASHYRHVDREGRRYRHDNIIRSASMGPRPNLAYEFEGYVPEHGWRMKREKLEKLAQEKRIYWSSGGKPYLIRYLDEQPGEICDNLWDDIPPVNSQAKERMGYPTQKPLALLERVIAASTLEEQLVLDPFCGCGTTIEAAQSLNRQWLGIDITHHAVDVIEGRLNERCPKADYVVHGRPEDINAAHDLARRDKYEFQWWANWLLGVQNYREHKKGPDRGIDGLIYFRNGPRGIGHIIVSVKGGQNIGPDMIASLAGTVQREDAQLGVFICLAEPTRRMRSDAAAAGFVQTAQGRFPQIQIAVIEDLLNGRRPPLPKPIETDAFRRPLRPIRQQKSTERETQLSLPLVITGQRGGKQSGVVEHLSGRVLAHIAAE